jgi:hypothetical protein
LFGHDKKEQVIPYTAINGWYLKHIPRDYRSANRNIFTTQFSIIYKWGGAMAHVF